MTSLTFLEIFDFALLDSSAFKEDSVREELIAPLLNALGYTASGANRIVRSKKLVNPFVSVGSGAIKRRQVKHFPDYLLEVQGIAAFVVDAKAPGEEIHYGANVEQAYIYAIHPEVRVPRYALCNGRELVIFNIDKATPCLSVHLSEIAARWSEIDALLRPEAFSKTASHSTVAALQPEIAYLNLTPPKELKDFKKQSAKRHFGVHGYFTRQVHSVVQGYIKAFTRPGDLVLDPFGGTGVTFVESLILGRRAIHVDINPLSSFILKNLVIPTRPEILLSEYERVIKNFKKKMPATADDVKLILSNLPYPVGVRLPRNSDVETLDKLFSEHQLAELALLKSEIKKVKDDGARGTLLLMFSGLLNKINLTYHASGVRSEGRGDSSAFRYYRYRLAPKPVELDVLKYFKSRLTKVAAAKQELGSLVSDDNLMSSVIRKGSATDMSWIPNEEIDYIYTDPPYGAKIAYLDLSTMWNAWLDLVVEAADFELEAIEGGEAKKTKLQYSDLLSLSISEMYRVLKFDRWMSFVFAHKDPAYWHIIVQAAEKAGFEYAGAVKQNNGQATFKKTQNPFTVLSGQLIINFRKVQNPKAIMKVNLGADIAGIVLETIESVIAYHTGATLEQINDELVLKGLELGFLDILSNEYSDLSPVLKSNFEYETASQKFFLKKETKFKAHIDEKVRVRYFLLSYLRRMQLQKQDSTFDDIIFGIMPLLRNGTTPANQTILGVLEEIAQHVGNGRWRLADGSDQKQLF
jgi:16S rRNA G966 N2-methylase RsmD